MKWFPLFTLIFLMSCNEARRPIRNTNSQQTLQAMRAQQIQKPQEPEWGIYASRGITHLAPKVKIDTERQEIEITGHSGQSCGIDFLDGQVLRYQLINNNELEIMMGIETLKLTRIHRSQNEDEIHGVWQSVDFKEETAKNRERIVTIFIRDHEIMNVDVYCEQRYGKLFEEFE